MSISDLANVITSVALLFFAWQQNRIFKEQNKIFATQGGLTAMLPESAPRISIWLKRYWPTAIMALALLANAYDIFDRHRIATIQITATATEWQNLQAVTDKTFNDETVELDGKRFVDCTFKKVEFLYHGRQGFAMSHDTFSAQPIVVRTDNAPAFMLARFIGAMDSESQGRAHFVISLIDQKGNLVP